MKIIFHKISNIYPNSIKGFIKGVEEGYKNFELDIRKCSDDYILYHDAVINDRYISHENLNELDSIDTLKNFIIQTSKYSGLNIYFDLKGTDLSIVDFFIKNKDILNFDNNHYFQSFNLEIINKLKAANSSFKCGFIVSGYRPISEKIINNIDYICIEEEFVGKYTEYSIDKYLWTVNSDKKKDYYLKLGISGIFTDYPDKFNQ